MSFTKPQIYNLALSALQLARQIIDTTIETNNEVNVLNLHWEIAFWSTLQDLDLDGTAIPITLELLVELTEGPWTYVYKYPTDCALLRRIDSKVKVDNRTTHIAKRTGIYSGQKAIWTDEPEAIADCIPKSVPLTALSSMAGMAIAYKLAFLSAPLIVGKGSKKLREDIEKNYIIAKHEAQQIDAMENFNYDDEADRSDFVHARLS